MPKNDRLIRLPEVLEMVAIKKSALWQWVAKGLFPRPLRIGQHTTVWRLSDVERFIETGKVANEDTAA